jgi:hypothetical protein
MVATFRCNEIKQEAIELIEPSIKKLKAAVEK